MTRFSRLTPRRQATLLSILRWVSVLLAVFLLAVLGYSLYVNVLNRPTAEVYVAQRDTAIESVYGTVAINSNGVLTVFAQNAGFLTTPPDLANNLKAQGIAVKKDQLLGTIADETILRLVRDAQAAYDAAVQHQKTGPPSQAPLDAAQDRLNRLLKLPPGNVAQADRDAARSAVTQLAAAVDNERLGLNVVVDQAASALKAAKEQEGRTQLKAPFDGILTGAFFLEHSYVLPNQAVFTVSDTAVTIVGQVNEEDVGSLKVPATPDGPFMTADVRLYAYGNTTFKAKLTGVLPSPDVNSSRYTVYLGFDKTPDDIKFGLTGEMNIILGRRENALLIRTSALYDSPDQILIVDDGVVEQRTVKIGFKSLERTQILEGIREGTQVIVSNQENFRPGQRVRAVKTNEVKVRLRQ